MWLIIRAIVLINIPAIIATALTSVEDLVLSVMANILLVNVCQATLGTPTQELAPAHHLAALLVLADLPSMEPKATFITATAE